MTEEFVLTDFSGNPSLGMFGRASSEFLIAPPGFKRAEVLQVDVVETPICNTELVGLFAAGNSNGILLPEIASRRERKVLKQAGIPTKVIKSNHTALGNLVLANDYGALISPELSEYKGEISEFLEVDVMTGTVADLVTVGSAGVATNNGVLLHRGASEGEMETIEGLLSVEGDIGTVNFGSPYVGSGIVANEHAVLAGKETKGPETARIQKALGFL